MVLPGYEITRDGRIKGPSGRWLAVDTSSGTARVTVSVRGVIRTHSLKTLVCEAFHGPAPSPDHVAAHIDGDVLNNHADNLKWATSRQGGCGPRPAIRGEKHVNHVLTWDKVRGIRQDYSVEDTTLRPSQRALARKYGVSNRTIHKILHNEYWQDPAYTPPAF